jgi:N-acetylmuramoyl-L-alanine amidase
MSKPARTVLLCAALFCLFLTTPQPARAFMLYENPQQIIITTPKSGYSTTSEQVSILGACDWNYPLYLNGEEITCTAHGFFSVYADLQPGENTFTFSQNGQNKSLTVTRREKSATPDEPTKIFDPADIEYYDQPIWGTVTSQNITHRSQADASPHLLNALAKETTPRIIGEYGDYYCLADQTFIYKSAVTLIDEPQSDNTINTIGAINTISAITITPQTAQNCTEISLQGTANALYKIELNDSALTLTLYDTTNDCTPTYTDNPIFSGIEVVPNEEASSTQYIFALKDNCTPGGYYANFQDGTMILGIKQPPKLTGDGLTGATILLDAGHGGNDIGASGPPGALGPQEKNINLVIANYAKRYLEAQGATVIMTRSTDVTLPLAERVLQILDVKPDLAISLHANSIAETADYGKFKGLRTYYTYDFGKRAAEKITPTISKLANLNKQNKTSPILSNLALTRIENCPALLIENAYMSNPEDYEMMIQSEYQRRFGEAVGRAAEEYLLELAGRKSIMTNPTTNKTTQPPTFGFAPILTNRYY